MTAAATYMYSGIGEEVPWLIAPCLRLAVASCFQKLIARMSLAAAVSFYKHHQLH